MNLTEYVQARIEVEGDCWIWTASKTGDGYPVMVIKKHKKRIHRLITCCPEGMFVTTTCGQRDCVNPKHLKVVTKSAYMKGRKQSADRVARMIVGRRSTRKLSVELARQIRARRGERSEVVAKDFGVSRSVISYIWNGHWWREPSPWAI